MIKKNKTENIPTNYHHFSKFISNQSKKSRDNPLQNSSNLLSRRSPRQGSSRPFQQLLITITQIFQLLINLPIYRLDIIH